MIPTDLITCEWLIVRLTQLIIRDFEGSQLNNYQGWNAMYGLKFQTNYTRITSNVHFHLSVSVVWLRRSQNQPKSQFQVLRIIRCDARLKSCTSFLHLLRMERFLSNRVKHVDFGNGGSFGVLRGERRPREEKPCIYFSGCKSPRSLRFVAKGVALLVHLIVQEFFLNPVFVYQFLCNHQMKTESYVEVQQLCPKCTSNQTQHV